MPETPAQALDGARRLISTLNCLCEIGSAGEMAPLRQQEFKLEIADRNTVWAAPEAQVYPKSEITVRGSGNIALLGAKCNLSASRIEISGKDNVLIIGPRVKMRNKHIKIAARRSLVVIGADTTFVGGAILCETDEQHVVIGSDCMFAAQVVVRTDDGHTIFDRTSRAMINTPKSVVVHSHVWLGNAVRVNKGAVVGTGSVVAQGSIVGGQVEPNCIYGGVPAKKLREDVVWSRSASYDDIPIIFR